MKTANKNKHHFLSLSKIADCARIQNARNATTSTVIYNDGLYIKMPFLT